MSRDSQARLKHLAPRSSPLIRAATEADRQYVMDAFDVCLKPFYEGDNRAHAHRVMHSHMNDGVDPRGFLSIKQSLYILWVNDRRVGLLNLVHKRQGTCKISPLLLYPHTDQSRGLGSLLLEHATQEALNAHADRLYCTVAERNEEALAFFRESGFLVCGRAAGQYKEGHMEILLQKRLKLDSRLSASDLISVSQSTSSDEWPEIRRLLSSDPDLDGTNVSAWLNSVRKGSRHILQVRPAERRPAWIFCARDRRGKLRAAAIAIKKKGPALKIMPIRATDEAGFRALVTDLPMLMQGKGDKAYIHLSPDADETSALLAAGWVLEGVMPGAYRSKSVTQQWGLELNTTATIKNLRIQNQFLSLIERGRKTLEVRVGYDHVRSMSAGDNLRLSSSNRSLHCTIGDVRVYSSFEEMLANENIEDALPGYSQRTALDELHQIYPPSKERLGVYVLALTEVHPGS